MNRSLESILKKNGGLSSFSKESVVVEFVEGAMIPGLEEQVSGIEGISRPAAADEATEAVIHAIQELIAEAETTPGKFTPEGKGVAKSEQVAKANGLPECGGV